MRERGGLEEYIDSNVTVVTVIAARNLGSALVTGNGNAIAGEL